MASHLKSSSVDTAETMSNWFRSSRSLIIHSPIVPPLPTLPSNVNLYFLPKKHLVCLPSHLGFDEITLARISFNANRVCEKNSRKTETIIEDNRIFSTRRENKENCSGPNVGCESWKSRVKTQTFGFVGKFCVHYQIYRGHNARVSSA